MTPARGFRALRGRLLLAIFPVLGAPPAFAQCTNLAAPFFNGCGLMTVTGTPGIACAGTPAVGNSAFAVTATIPCQAAFPTLLVGACLPSAVQITGPFGTGGFCGPTMGLCAAWVGPTIFAGVPGAAVPGGWSFGLPIPNVPALAGATVCVQEANFCILFVGQCLAASQGISITIQ